MHFSHIRVSDLILVNHDGEVVEGDRPREPGGVRHPLAGARRPSRRGRAPRTRTRCTARRGRRSAGCSTRSRRTRARSTRTTRCSTTTPASCSTSRRASASPTRSATTRPSILRNHGLLTVGHSVDEAVWWFITMERSCQAQLLAEAAGTPVLIDARRWPEHTAGQVGTHSRGWFSFQPLYARIVARAARPARLSSRRPHVATAAHPAGGPGRPRCCTSGSRRGRRLRVSPPGSPRR